MKALNSSGRIMNLPSFFTHNSLKNCHLEFSSDGVYLWVSLNVTPKMVKYLSPNNVYKSESMYIYSLKQKLNSCNKNEISDVHNTLLRTAMMRCREAKVKSIEIEIEILNNQLNGN